MKISNILIIILMALMTNYAIAEVTLYSGWPDSMQYKGIFFNKSKSQFRKYDDIDNDKYASMSLMNEVCEINLHGVVDNDFFPYTIKDCNKEGIKKAIDIELDKKGWQKDSQKS